MQDALCMLCEDQAITGDAVSENTYDMKSATADMHRGRQLYVVCFVTTTFAGGTSLAIQLVTDSAADLGTDVVLVQTAAIVQASLTAGRQPIVIPVCDPDSVMTRYLGLAFDDTGAFTAGAITAYITENPPDNFA